MAPALDAEQARQLRHRNSQAGTGLEAHKDAVADQLYERAQSQHPSEHAKSCDGEGHQAGDLGVTLRVSLGHRAHGPGNHQRNGGSRPHRELTRGSEQGIAQSAEQIAVDANLRL